MAGLTWRRSECRRSHCRLSRPGPAGAIGRPAEEAGSELPLPNLTASADRDGTRRVDGTADICSLGKEFRNCLANYAQQVDAGTCAIYLWGDLTAPAVCLVTRHGRLGWSLSEALGPSNAELDGNQLQEITTAFAKAAVPQYSAFRSLECILQADCTTRPRTRRHRHQDLEQRLWELEEPAWIEDVVDVVA